MIARLIVGVSESVFKLIALAMSAVMIAWAAGFPLLYRQPSHSSAFVIVSTAIWGLLQLYNVWLLQPNVNLSITSAHAALRFDGFYQMIASAIDHVIRMLLVLSAHAVKLLLRTIPLIAGAGYLTTNASEESEVSRIILCSAGVLFAQVAISAMFYKPSPQPSDNTLRGRRLTSFDAAQQSAEGELTTAAIPWGGLIVPVDSQLTHFALVGTTRSGKTTNLRLIMQAVLPRLTTESAYAGRALVYDPKTEFVPLLTGMGIRIDDLRLLHPFDARSWAWDIAADIDTPTDAHNIAAAFIPDGTSSQEKFFPDAARDVLAAGILALQIIAPRAWRLRDLLLLFRDPERVTKVFGKSEHTRHILKLYAGDPRTLGNITATLRKHLGPFEPIAACWEHCGSRWMSLNEWLASRSILVMGYDESAQQQIGTINRCLFQRLADLLLSPAAKAAQGRSWIILDEAAEIGALSSLHSLLTRGAGLGTCAILGFQGIQGMEDVYNEKVAGELLGQCDNVAVFRLGNNRKTAEWASELIGKAERLENYWSETYGKEYSSTKNQQLHERYLFLPEQLQSLRATNPINGLQGIFISTRHGVVDAAEAGIDGQLLFQELLIPPDEHVAPFQPRPASQHFLQDWDDADYRRLGIDKNNPSGDTLDSVVRLS